MHLDNEVGVFDCIDVGDIDIVDVVDMVDNIADCEAVVEVGMSRGLCLSHSV